MPQKKPVPSQGRAFARGATPFDGISTLRPLLIHSGESLPLLLGQKSFLRREAQGFYRNVLSPGNAFSLGHFLSVDDDVHTTPRHCPYGCNNTSSYYVTSSSKTDTLHVPQLLSEKAPFEITLQGIVPPIFGLSSSKFQKMCIEIPNLLSNPTPKIYERPFRFLPSEPVLPEVFSGLLPG